jgi:hypothetical protein
MESIFNTDSLAIMFKLKRANKGLRVVAEEIGEVSAAIKN